MQVGEVTRTTVSEVVEAPGTVSARAMAAVTAPADGTVVDVLVEDGQTVARGAVLLRVDSPAAQESLRTALAANAGAAGAGPAGAALAAQQLQAARATVDALTVRAPIAGVVTLGAGAPSATGALDGVLGALVGGAAPPQQSSTTTLGEVAPGVPVTTGTPLLTVTDVSVLGIVAEVDETDVLLVRPGLAAEVTLDALPDEEYAATVRSVDLSPATSARGGVSYRVRLALTARPGQQPRPGMSAIVGLRVREATDVLSVPTGAVVRDGDRDVVFAVRDGRAVRREVELGASGEDRVELRSGVREGERVVVRDADTLADGDELDL